MSQPSTRVSAEPACHMHVCFLGPCCISVLLFFSLFFSLSPYANSTSCPLHQKKQFKKVEGLDEKERILVSFSSFPLYVDRMFAFATESRYN